MLAIQGHIKRGKEVIQILESLGGINRMSHSGRYTNYFYYISGDDNTIALTEVRPQHLNVFTLEEFERKFPFKIGETVITTLNHVGTIIGIVNGKYKVLFKEDSALIVPRRLKPYKEMEVRRVAVTLDKAKEWYKKGGALREIALQAFTKEELNPLPRSWEEYCKHTTTLTTSFSSCAKYDAFVKLEHLRDCWWGDWKPEWNASHKYAIKNLQGEITILGCSTVAAFLTFPTREIAEEFLKCFKDLIELAKDLI